MDLPAHDAVDLGAKRSLIFHIVSDPLFIPAYKLKNYYRSSILTSLQQSRCSLQEDSKLFPGLSLFF